LTAEKTKKKSHDGFLYIYDRAEAVQKQPPQTKLNIFSQINLLI